MSDEAQLHADAAKGARVESLLRDGVIVEVFAKLEAEFIQAWKTTQLRDTDGRERLWQAVQIAGKIPALLRSVANNGKLAEHELREIAKGTHKRFGII